MTLQTKIHDGVIAVLNLIGALLVLFVHVAFVWINIAVAAVMISSLFTGWCPVHWSVGKIFPPKK